METILNILTDLHPDVDFSSAEGLIEDAILDSMDIVTIINEIYTEYDVRVPAEMIVPENFNSASAIFEMVQKLLDE